MGSPKEGVGGGEGRVPTKSRDSTRYR
ncbi:hypothetical protein NPIL_530601, partial [Nephila pilipes]